MYYICNMYNNCGLAISAFALPSGSLLVAGTVRVAMCEGGARRQPPPPPSPTPITTPTHPTVKRLEGQGGVRMSDAPMTHWPH